MCVTFQVRQKSSKPCSFDCVEQSNSTFDDLIKCAKWMDRNFPPFYALHAKKIKTPCKPVYAKYINLPWAFRPAMTPSGLWDYKRSCSSNNKVTETAYDSFRVPAGGETESVQISSADLVIDTNPFDSGATCKMYKGTLKRGGASIDVACKEFLIQMANKYKRRIEKEVKCVMKLKHPNVLQHLGINFERSILVSEYLCKEITLSDGEIECIHNARQLLDGMEDNLPWAHRLEIVRDTCRGIKYLHENGVVHCDVKAGNIFIGGGRENRYIVKVGDFGQANFDFGQFSVTQTSTLLSTGSQKNKVGTAPYTAPELIELGAKRDFPSDVYSTGMVMVEFTMPERSHPWEGEISTCDLIFHHVRQGRRPTIDAGRLNSLEDHLKEDWLRTIEKCLEQDPEKRPSMSSVAHVLEEMTAKENQQLDVPTVPSERVTEGAMVEDIALAIHQGTVAERAGDIAITLFENEGQTAPFQEELEACVQKLDGSNACVFLAMKNIDNIFSDPGCVDNSVQLREQVEKVMQELPEKINDFRDVNAYSNIDEALKLLQDKNLIRHRYSVTEMIKDQLCTSQEGKRSQLRNALLALMAESPSLAIYTCTPVSFVIGFIRDAFLIIDTHCIPAHLGGNGNAIIKVVRCKGDIQSGIQLVIDWLEERMKNSIGHERGLESLVQLSIQDESNCDGAIDVEMASCSTLNEDDQLLLSFTEDFNTSDVNDDEDDALLASLPDSANSPAECSKMANHAGLFTQAEALEGCGAPACKIKKESNNVSSQLWENPSRNHAFNESTELLWKGHLTKFQHTTFKRFQLDAIRAVEAKKDVVIVQKTGSGKSLCFQVPSLFDKTKTTVVICPTISLINSQVESLKRLEINAVAVGPQNPVEMLDFTLEGGDLPALMYTTPEYFATKLNHRLTTMSNVLKLVVIDEVHKVFDRNSEFRSSYDSLRRLHDDFPGIPIMALTATLNEEQLKSLCENYLSRPVLIKSTVDRPNIKLNIGKYQTKRPVKGDKSLVWMETSRQIGDLLGEEYGIIYMDFKRDVELMLSCLEECGKCDAKGYHGGLSHQEKMTVDTEFRNKDFQLLVATESYEVGTHSPHVHSVVRLGCMRNLGVLIQEFGRAGRGGEQADGYLWFNEYKDDQRLTYWTMGCSSEEVENIKTSYEESWRWIYGIYNRVCLRESLLLAYEETTVNLDPTKGECCSSCDIPEGKEFNAKNTAILMMKAIQELESIFPSSEGVNEDNLLSWLLGSKRDWISKPEIQSEIDKSTTFGRGELNESKKLERSWWSRHLRQLISLKFVAINFKIYRGKKFSTTSRKYKVSKEGEEFLNNPSDLHVLSPSIDPFGHKKKSSGSKQSTTRESRGLHHLPKIRNAISTKNWFEMTRKEDYEFPGFSETMKDIGYCKNIKEMKGFGSHQRPDFMWEDNQLAKRHTTTKRCQIIKKK